MRRRGQEPKYEKLFVLPKKNIHHGILSYFTAKVRGGGIFFPLCVVVYQVIIVIFEHRLLKKIIFIIIQNLICELSRLSQ